MYRVWIAGQATKRSNGPENGANDSATTMALYCVADESQESNIKSMF